MRQAKTQSEPTEIDGFAIPKWWRCQWQRLECGQDSCRMCSQMARSRRRHLDRGDDPDSPEAVFEDVAEAFRSVKTLITREAKRRGIDLSRVSAEEEEIAEPPRPDEFLLFQKVMGWHGKVRETSEGMCRQHGEGWTKSVAAKDLHWYASLLPAKIYRQLTSRWEREHDTAGYSEVDYRYTRYVIDQILSRLKTALASLTAAATNPVVFMVLTAQLKQLEHDLATL